MIVHGQTIMDDHVLLNGYTGFTDVKLTMADHGADYGP